MGGSVDVQNRQCVGVEERARFLGRWRRRITEGRPAKQQDTYRVKKYEGKELINLKSVQRITDAPSDGVPLSPIQEGMHTPQKMHVGAHR